jgi:hypothetical protein
MGEPEGFEGFTDWRLHCIQDALLEARAKSKGA